ELKQFEPNEFKIGGNRFKCELRSMGPVPPEAKNTVREARQTVMPGSIYSHKTKPGEYDISVWYHSDTKTATHISEIAATTARKTSFHALITGIAFGTFLYIVQPHWLSGNRQNFALRIAGWLARLVRESQGINENDGISRGTYCPIGTPEVA